MSQPSVEEGNARQFAKHWISTARGPVGMIPLQKSFENLGNVYRTTQCRQTLTIMLSFWSPCRAVKKSTRTADIGYTLARSRRLRSLFRRAQVRSPPGTVCFLMKEGVILD